MGCLGFSSGNNLVVLSPTSCSGLCRSRSPLGCDRLFENVVSGMKSSGRSTDLRKQNYRIQVLESDLCEFYLLAPRVSSANAEESYVTSGGSKEWLGSTPNNAKGIRSALLAHLQQQIRSRQHVCS